MKLQKDLPLTFNSFCQQVCDGMYNPMLSNENQCIGYIKLKEMVDYGIKPASLEEIDRWEKNPTQEELTAEPDLKYLSFLHPNLRPVIIANWDYIKKLRTGKWRLI